MAFRRFLRVSINKLGVRIMRESTYSKLRSRGSAWIPSYQASPLDPADARDLHFGNPRLIRLTERYADHPVGPSSLWEHAQLLKKTSLNYFRGDNLYIWQVSSDRMTRGLNPEASYGITAYYAERRDALGLFDVLEEDGTFGCYTFTFETGRLISRDLLDSVMEINYLASILGADYVANSNLMDIGAGYGRLAHRWLTAFSTSRVYLYDGIPTSTFLSEFYLNYRGLADRAMVVDLPDAEQNLPDENTRIATNIHSFSECTLSAVKWWLALVEKSSVEHLFIVPNSGLTSFEGINYEDEIRNIGFRLIDNRPMYETLPASRFGLGPSDYFLFARE